MDRGIEIKGVLILDVAAGKIIMVIAHFVLSIPPQHCAQLLFSV